MSDLTLALGTIVCGEEQEEEKSEACARSAEARPRPCSGQTVTKDGEETRRGCTLLERATPSISRSRSAGGILVFKGNEVLLGEDEEPCSWTRLGIEATPRGALRYFVGEGGQSEVEVASPDGTLFDAEHDREDGGGNGGDAVNGGDKPAPGWRHVAVVKNQSDVLLFVDGRCCGEGSLPQHLLWPTRPQQRTTVREVESSHPYPNSADEYWLVHVPGATRVTVRFDPKSKTEPEYDFVRFYKDRTRTEVRKTFVFGTPVFYLSDPERPVLWRWCRPSRSNLVDLAKVW